MTRHATPMDLVYRAVDPLDAGGDCFRLILHLVGDRGRWPRTGFSKRLAERWPVVRREFREWARGSTGSDTSCALGRYQISAPAETTAVVSMAVLTGRSWTCQPLDVPAFSAVLAQMGPYGREMQATAIIGRFDPGPSTSWTDVVTMLRDSLVHQGVPVIVCAAARPPTTKNMPVS